MLSLKLDLLGPLEAEGRTKLYFKEKKEPTYALGHTHHPYILCIEYIPDFQLSIPNTVSLARQ